MEDKTRAGFQQITVEEVLDSVGAKKLKGIYSYLVHINIFVLSGEFGKVLAMVVRRPKGGGAVVWRQSERVHMLSFVKQKLLRVSYDATLTVDVCFG